MHDRPFDAVRRILHGGADLIKVMAPGAVLTPGELPGAVQFGLDELRAAVEEAGMPGWGRWRQASLRMC